MWEGNQLEGEFSFYFIFGWCSLTNRKVLCNGCSLRNVEEGWSDVRGTASWRDTEAFFFAAAYFTIVLSPEVWCLSLPDCWFPWMGSSNCMATWWVGSAWWSDLKTNSRGKPNWFLLDQWLSDSLHALRADRKEEVRNWGQTQYEIQGVKHHQPFSCSHLTVKL